MQAYSFQQVPPPALNLKKNPAAWQRAIDNAASQLEHQRVKMENLALLASYGVPLWKVHAQQLDAEKERYVPVGAVCAGEVGAEVWR